jgi:SAM-dependent methyltransferase
MFRAESATKLGVASWFERARADGYVLGQRLVGAVKARAECLGALELRAGERVLDVGCGPAYYFGALPACEYYGFDTNVGQISVARARYGERAQFFAEPYTAQHQQQLAPFDKVLLLGLLHHLDDSSAAELLRVVARSLKPGGRVVALDTSLFDGQSRLSRLLAKNDRGDYVRRPEEFQRLAAAAFEQVDARIVGDTLLMPSAHLLMLLSKPRAERAPS